MDEVRRSVLNVRVVVETRGSEREHERSVQWAAQRIKSAHYEARFKSSVAVRVTGPNGRDMGFAGHGEELSRMSRDIIDDFFDDDDDSSEGQQQSTETT